MKCYFYESDFHGLYSRKRVAALDIDLFQSHSSGDCDWYLFPRWLYGGKLASIREAPRRVKKGCGRLAYWVGNEKRHIIFEYNDPTEPFRVACVKFRASVIKQNSEVNTYSIPYPQRPMSHDLFASESVKPRHLVSFCGDKSSWKRSKMIRQTLKKCGDRADIVPRKAYYGDLDPKKKPSFAVAYRENLLNSHFALCPRGAGPSSRRIFEAMAAGRVPVIISPGYVKPFSHCIDWSLFSFHGKSTAVVLDLIDGCTVSKAMQMGKLAKEIWHDYIQDSMWWKSIKPILEGKSDD